MRLTDGVALDPAIAPLCAALAAAGCETVYSCGAHLDREAPRDRAYVTFACGDAEWVSALRDRLAAPPAALAAVRRDLHYECLFGRYTLSLWAPLSGPRRLGLDRALASLAAWIRARSRAAQGPAAGCTVPAGSVPVIIPCRLTLGRPAKRCGWTGSLLEMGG